ncbi:LysE family translocator [Aestuariirhabdus litorea]|uniref:LysE family translocator n=1 Tax=Aestuariirhabdus litorea TaxID=2528527 RepID=A0A3P3VPA9_9GAMM|nr:LysE family translocator [Aestuariirhabdus litorea]RRJ84254.1 LysE family translocator [Aestuariirhabdus litorea]RWW97476.1 LysE family translocator [Endozoicomonadaceae bacterium GTF-13]
MSVESALTFFIAIFIFGVTPGPGVFAILARAMNEGASSCFTLALGMTISDIIYLVLACLGLAAIADNWSGLFTLIRWVGAGYLIYLGWIMWRQPASLAVGDYPRKRHQGMSFVQGFLISASNPKVILFYIAFLPTFMDLTRLHRSDIALAAGLTLVALMAGLMLIALSAAQARRYFRSERAMKGLNRISGSIMAAAGGYLILR